VSPEGLKQIVRRSLQAEGFGKAAEVSILLTDDEEIRGLNARYRRIDCPTDVLSFSQLEGEPMEPVEEPVPVGDIVISVETAMRQAERLGRSLQSEMDLLVAHGMLHLLGYNDVTEGEAQRMHEREEEILRHIDDG
jgi:probable rRNA maturation factor